MFFFFFFLSFFASCLSFYVSLCLFFFPLPPLSLSYTYFLFLVLFLYTFSLSFSSLIFLFPLSIYLSIYVLFSFFTLSYFAKCLFPLFLFFLPLSFSLSRPPYSSLLLFPLYHLRATCFLKINLHDSHGFS